MAREGFFYKPEPVGKQAYAQRRNGRLVEDDGRSVASKLKGSKDQKPLDYKGSHGETMQEGGADRQNMTNAVRQQQLKNDFYGHKTGGGMHGSEGTGGHPEKRKDIPPDPSRGPTAKGTPEEIARDDKQRAKTEEDRANGITPPDELDKADSKKVGPEVDWKGTPPLKSPPPAKTPDKAPPKKPGSTAHPAPKIPPMPKDKAPEKPKGPPPIIPVPGKNKPIALRKTGLGSYARARAGY